MQINSAVGFDSGLNFRQSTTANDKTKTVKTENEINENLSEKKNTVEKISDTPKVLAKSEITLSFSLDERTKEIVIKMLNEKTREVVRQIPTEVSLKLAEAYKKLREIAS